MKTAQKEDPPPEKERFGLIPIPYRKSKRVHLPSDSPFGLWLDAQAQKYASTCILGSNNVRREIETPRIEVMSTSWDKTTLWSQNAAPKHDAISKNPQPNSFTPRKTFSTTMDELRWKAPYPSKTSAISTTTNPATRNGITTRVPIATDDGIRHGEGCVIRKRSETDGNQNLKASTNTAIPPFDSDASITHQDEYDDADFDDEDLLELEDMFDDGGIRDEDLLALLL